MTLSSDILFSDFPPGCPRSPTWPPSTVSILGLAFRCNQPCRTPACQEALALCETPICLVHWDKPSPRELLEWKDEYKKAQLKRQGWAAASGHSLSAALLQTTFILMRCVWLPCLHTTQRSETDRCAGVSVKAGMSDIWTQPFFFKHTLTLCPSLLLSSLSSILSLIFGGLAAVGSVFAGVPPKARSTSDSRLRWLRWVVSGDELLRAAHTDPAGAVTTVQCERSMNNISAGRDYSRRGRWWHQNMTKSWFSVTIKHLC